MKQLYRLTLCGTAALILATPALAARDSHPDLTGTYDVSTLTPLQRPEEFGDSLELTREQAEAIVAENEARIRERDANRGPVTSAPPVGGAPPIGTDDEFRESSGAGNVGGYNNFWVDPGTDVFMVDGKPVGELTANRTAPAAFTASETFDVGLDLGSTVSEAYSERRPFEFDGKIKTVNVQMN